MSIFESLIDDFKANIVDKERGTAFEKLCSAFLTLSPEFIGHSIKVQKLGDWSYTNSQWTGGRVDLGIDLVITDLDTGEFYAVQCKFREDSDDQTLKYESMTNLVTQASGNNGVLFSRLILMSNISEPSIHLEQSLKQHHVAFYNKEWFEHVLNHIHHITQQEIDTVSKFNTIVNQPTQNRRLVSFPHQNKIILDTIKHLVNKDRMILTSACGTGKTLVGLHLIDHFVKPQGTAVIFVPTLLLVKQFAQFIQEQQDNAHLYDVAVVCSDESTVKADTLNISPTSVFTRFLSTREDISSFLNNKGPLAKKVIITTYHSAYKLKEFQENHPVPFDFGIYDESHKTTGKQGSSAISINFVNRVFMTATPRVVTTLTNNKEKILSMDDKNTYGDIGVNYSFRQAIKDEVLVSYKLEILLAPKTDYANAINDRVYIAKDEKGELIDGKFLAMGTIAKDLRARKKMGIVYFNSIKESRKFASAINTKQEKFVYHIDGYMSTKERDTFLKEAEVEGGLLSNVSLLTEGVDVPELEVVMFGEQRSSKVDIVQSIGRVMRKSKTDPNKVGRIILPIAIETTDDAEEWIYDNKSLRVFNNLLLALIETDSLLLENAAEILTARGADSNNGKNGQSFDQIFGGIISLVTVDPAWNLAEQSLFIDSLKTQTLNLGQLSWWKKYGNLKEFIEEHGRFPKWDDSSEDMALTDWARYQDGVLPKLSEAQKKALLELPARTKTPSWDEKFESLEKFIGNNARYPKNRSLDEFEKSLAFWVSGMKTAYRSHGRSKIKITSEQIDKFQKLPKWSWGGTTLSWEETFDIVSEFVATKDYFPSTKEKPELHTWIRKQKLAKKVGQLSDSRISSLSNLQGWEWEATVDPALAILDWLESNKLVPAWDLPEDKWNWLKDNRDRIIRTPELYKQFKNFKIWDFLEIKTPWIRNYRNIRRFLNQKDSDFSLASLPRNMRIWVQNNKANIENLGKRQQELIAEFPLEDTTRGINARWLKNLEEVKKYTNSNGKIDFNFMPEAQRNWITNQKAHIDDNSPKQRLLEKLLFENFSLKITTRWLENLEEVKKHANQDGKIYFNGLPPAQRNWLKFQNKNINNLSLEQKRLLKIIPLGSTFPEMCSSYQ